MNRDLHFRGRPCGMANGRSTISRKNVDCAGCLSELDKADRLAKILNGVEVSADDIEAGSVFPADAIVVITAPIREPELSSDLSMYAEPIRDISPIKATCLAYNVTRADMTNSPRAKARRRDRRASS